MKGFGKDNQSKNKIESVLKKSSINSIKGPLSKKEDILKLAFKFHKNGDLTKAKEYYKYFLEKGFVDSRVLNNYGVLCEKSGDIVESIRLYSLSIELYPKNYNSYFNLGNILLKQGKLKEASFRIKEAISIQPKLPLAYFNLAIISRQLGKLNEAEKLYLEAINLEPNFAEAFSNLGNIYKEKGNYDKALNSHSQAVLLNPTSPECYFNLGNTFKMLGYLDKALDSYDKAIDLNSNKPEFYYALANTFTILERYNDAFNIYLEAIKLFPSDIKNYIYMSEFLANFNPKDLSKKHLIYILEVLLNRTDIRHQDLFNSFNSLLSPRLEIDSNLNFSKSTYSFILTNKLVHLSMSKLIFSDFLWEKIFTEIRLMSLNLIYLQSPDTKNISLGFLLSLSEQCFLNEYLYYKSPNEIKIINEIISNFSKYTDIDKTILILSCYLPLYELSKRSPIRGIIPNLNKLLNPIIKSQLIDVKAEEKIKAKIIKIGDISNSISTKVMSQYEENPYPRWKNSYLYSDQDTLISDVINNEIYPNKIKSPNNNIHNKVLIAGCGTGNQILQARRYKNSDIIGIDLSLSSLSYTQRKLSELNISNVELFQMDILNLNLIKKKFDIIECGGVLHHMKSPSDGLASLLSVLNFNGFIKIGLYSEISRSIIVQARNIIHENNYTNDTEGIRSFRSDVLCNKYPEIINLKYWRNFYSISECRDLCFHSQEHRFTVQQIQQLLKYFDLKFLGFLLPRHIKSQYLNSFPDDLLCTNLDNWSKFEENHPNTFVSMYQFWVTRFS